MTAINYVRDLPGGGVVAARGHCTQASPLPAGTAVRPRCRARVLRSGLGVALHAGGACAVLTCGLARCLEA